MALWNSSPLTPLTLFHTKEQQKIQGEFNCLWMMMMMIHMNYWILQMGKDAWHFRRCAYYSRGVTISNSLRTIFRRVEQQSDVRWSICRIWFYTQFTCKKSVSLILGWVFATIATETRLSTQKVISQQEVSMFDCLVLAFYSVDSIENWKVFFLSYDWELKSNACNFFAICFVALLCDYYDS